MENQKLEKICGIGKKVGIAGAKFMGLYLGYFFAIPTVGRLLSKDLDSSLNEDSIKLSILSTSLTIAGILDIMGVVIAINPNSEPYEKILGYSSLGANILSGAYEIGRVIKNKIYRGEK